MAKFLSGWKTVLGIVVALMGYLAQPEIVALLPSQWAKVITAIGAALAAFGIRSAIAKAAPDDAPIAPQLTGGKNGST